MNAIIELIDVHKEFRKTPVIRGANAEFEEGKCHAIVGPNGAGKSVLLKLVCDLLVPDAGTVRRSDRISHRNQLRPGTVGAVIDRPAFIPLATGFNNLKDLATILHKITDDEIKDAMKQVGLDPDLKQRARNYSLGMKQKLGLAQAIMEDPPLLVLDEPLNALDVESVDLVRSMIRGRVDAGSTVIFTSHNPEDVRLLADEVWQLADGRLLQLAPESRS